MATKYKMEDGERVLMTDAEEADLYSNVPPATTALEIALLNLRSKRNNLLSKTDWTASSDLTMSDEMKTYRQELRDATNGLDTVKKVKAYTFPTEVTK